MFDIITLEQLTGEQRPAQVVRRLGIGTRDGRTLRKRFQEKWREPYIHEVAGNPIQLTILLDLLDQQGAAAPTDYAALRKDLISADETTAA